MWNSLWVQSKNYIVFRSNDTKVIILDLNFMLVEFKDFEKIIQDVLFFKGDTFVVATLDSVYFMKVKLELKNR